MLLRVCLYNKKISYSIDFRIYNRDGSYICASPIGNQNPLCLEKAVHFFLSLYKNDCATCWKRYCNPKTFFYLFLVRCLQ